MNVIFEVGYHGFNSAKFGDLSVNVFDPRK